MAISLLKENNMIITITGKPCSGKGTVSKILCDKYNFEYICTGDMFRTLAYSYGYDNILEFQKDERIKDVDNDKLNHLYEELEYYSFLKKNKKENFKTELNVKIISNIGEAVHYAELNKENEVKSTLSDIISDLERLDFLLGEMWTRDTMYNKKIIRLICKDDTRIKETRSYKRYIV